MNLYSVQEITATAGGGSATVNLSNDIGIVHIASAAPIILSSPYSIYASEGATKGMFIKFLHAGGFTTNGGAGNSLNVFGYAVPDEHALYEATITAYYNGTAWEVRVCPSQEGVKNIDGSTIVNGTIPTTALADNAITNDKLNTITQGYIKIGGTSGAPTDLNAKTDGYMLIGDGTDINSVIISGDVAIDNTGATTIQAGSVTNAMLETAPVSYLEYNVTLTSENIVGLNGTPLLLLAAPGAGVAIDIISMHSSLVYNSATYTDGGELQVYYNGYASTPIMSSPVTAVTGGVNTYSKFVSESAVIPGGGNNDALYIKDVGADAFATGNSTLKLNILYRLLSF